MRASQQMFLQSFMSRQVLNSKDVFQLLRSSCEKYEDVFVEEDLRQKVLDFVLTINTQLKPMGMEIKKGVDECNGQSFYGLVNTVENNIALLASQYSDNELQFFKKLVELIVTSPSGTIGSIAAVNISDSLSKKMSKSEAQALLDTFQTDQWIGKTAEGKMYLAARCIMEMEQYVFDMCGDSAIRCNMCKKLCVQGQSCGQCPDTKLHKHCSSKLFKDQTDRKCPVCRAAWSGMDNVLQPSTSTGGQTRKRKASS